MNKINHACTFRKDFPQQCSARIGDRSLLRSFDVWSVVVLEWCNNLTAYFCERVFCAKCVVKYGPFLSKTPSIPYLPYSKALCCSGFRMRLPQLTFQITLCIFIWILSHKKMHVSKNQNLFSIKKTESNLQLSSYFDKKFNKFL